MHILDIELVCPVNFLKIFPCSVFHIVIFLSELPETIKDSSMEIHALNMESVCVSIIFNYIPF
jgi:hypothetical protein